MKKLIFLVLILTVVGYYFRADLNQLVYFSYCDDTLFYDVGTIDPHFSLTQDQLKSQLQDAALVWNTALEKPYLTYKPGAKLKVNLVYDERQQYITQISSLTSKVNSSDSELATTEQQLDAWKDTIEQEIKDLNEQIAEWNSKGGAPKDVYENLVKTQQKIQAEIADFNVAVANFNTSVSNLDLDVNTLNSSIDSFNDLLSIKPEGGIYDPNVPEIDIYFYTNKAEFKHIAMHEFGHAMGIDHNFETNSIMYPVISESVTLSKVDEASIIDRCKERNRLDELSQNATKIIGNFNKVIKTYILSHDANN